MFFWSSDLNKKYLLWKYYRNTSVYLNGQVSSKLLYDRRWVTQISLARARFMRSELKLSDETGNKSEVSGLNTDNIHS